MSPGTIAPSEAWSDFTKWWAGWEPASQTSSTPFNTSQPLASAIALMSNSAIAVIDVATMQYLFLSKNFAEFAGRTMEEYSNGGVKFGFSIIHPDDVDGVLTFSALITSYFRSLPDVQKPFFRAFWDYRISGRTGNYCRVFQQDCVLKYDESGNIKEMLLVASSIENVVQPGSQHLRLTNGIQDQFYKYDHRTKQNIALELLSQREMEIAKLIAQSFSLKQVAYELGISFNTVKVHSANMLEKVQANGSLEMINILRTWAFI